MNIVLGRGNLFKTLPRVRSFDKWWTRPSQWSVHNSADVDRQRRYFFYRVLDFINPPDRHLKRRDQVASHYEIVYKGTSTNYIRRSDWFFTIFLCGCSSWLALITIAGRSDLSYYWSITPLEYIPFIVAFLVGSFYVNHTLAKAYVYRIYYSEADDQYAVILKGRGLFAERKLAIPRKGIVPSRGNASVHYLANFFRLEIYETKSGDKTKLIINSLVFSIPAFYRNLVDLEGER